ncbi:YkgJ family cysteine cluster protein [Candidatus Woesearchaeota archaeon]|nr:YkgJ family cysteine cluster protein [Candidatus Woesearchaeota archaeon]
MKLPMIEPEKTFQCNQCGSCCSHIRGMMPRDDKEFIQKMAYGKLPLVQLIPIEKMSFPLWDWEAKRFMEWQKEVDVDAKVKPSRGILDLNSNKAIIVTYYMDSDACPLLQEKKCSIYHRKRAYVCRLFPFQRGPFLKTSQEPTKHNMFGTCGAMDPLMPIIPETYEDMVKFLSKAFPDGSFENAVQFDYITEWVNKTIIDLMRKKMLRPAMNYPYDLFLKRFQNAEKVDFTDFLEQSGYIESKEELIKSFDDNKDAKQLIDEFLRQ